MYKPPSQAAVAVNLSLANTGEESPSSSSSLALKKQLEESQHVIHELQNKIQKLAIENTELKSRIKSQNIDHDDEVDGDELVELYVALRFLRFV